MQLIDKACRALGLAVLTVGLGCSSGKTANNDKTPEKKPKAPAVKDKQTASKDKQEPAKDSKATADKSKEKTNAQGPAKKLPIDMDLVSLEKLPKEVAKHKGKIVVLDLWALW